MKTCKNLLLSNLAMNKMKETKTVFNLMIDSAKNQEKEIDPSSNENEEEKTTIDPLERKRRRKNHHRSFKGIFNNKEKRKFFDYCQHCLSHDTFSREGSFRRFFFHNRFIKKK